MPVTKATFTVTFSIDYPGIYISNVSSAIGMIIWDNKLLRRCQNVVQHQRLISWSFPFQEEVTPPEINDLLWLCAEAYTRNQMVKMEELILDAIHFEMFVPTGSFFLEYYACCEMTDSDNVTLDEFR